MYGSVDDVEYTILLVPGSRAGSGYRRIGMVVRKTKVLSLEKLSSLWEQEPSCFETGGQDETVIIY
jgi:hypothetical protein